MRQHNSPFLFLAVTRSTEPEVESNLAEYLARSVLLAKTQGIDQP